MSSMGGRYDFYKQERNILSSMRDEEFQEDDVWSVFKEPKNPNSKIGTVKNSSSFTIRRMPTAARMIPRSNSGTIVHDQKVVQHSAPVGIPDWSKIYGRPAMASKNALVNDDRGDGDNGIARGGWDSDDEEDDDDGGGGGSGERLPPHEWIDRRLARRQISSFSMCEGVGRTLKGRDISKVRNAVLTKTGFLE